MSHSSNRKTISQLEANDEVYILDETNKKVLLGKVKQVNKINANRNKNEGLERNTSIFSTIYIPEIDLFIIINELNNKDAYYVYSCVHTFKFIVFVEYEELVMYVLNDLMD